MKKILSVLICIIAMSCSSDDDKIEIPEGSEWCSEDVQVTAKLRYYNQAKDTLALDIKTQNYAPSWEEQFELTLSIHGNNQPFEEVFHWAPNDFIWLVPIDRLPNNGQSTSDIESFFGTVCVDVPDLENYPQCPLGLEKNYYVCTEITN